MSFSLFRAGFRLLIAVGVLAAAIVPGRAAAWTTAGPYGGIVDQIVVDPKTPTTVYEASRGGGVFRSLNKGGRWTRQSTGLADPLVYTLAIDPSNPHILYAAGGNGVFRSINGAVTWTMASLLVNVRQLVVDPKTPTTLYAIVSQSALYKSTDSGKTWTSQFNQLQSQSLYCIVVDPITPTKIYVGAQGGVWHTANGGASWTLSTNGLGSGFIIVQQLAINPKTPSILYAGTGTGLKRSANSAVSWTAVAAAPSSLTLLAVDPTTPTQIYGTVYPGSLYASTDSGGHWAQRASVTADFHGNLRTLAVDPTTSAQLYAGTDHGVFASTTSGSAWKDTNVGLANTLVTTLAINPATPTILYAGTEYGGIFRTTNGGVSWTRIDDDWVDEVSGLVIDPKTPSILYFSSSFGNGVFKSTDSSTTWTNPLPSKVVLALAIDRTTTSTLLAGIGGGGSTVLRSLNSGGTWAAAANGLPAAGSLQASSLSVDAGTAILTDESNGAYTSLNAGSTWSANDPTNASSAQKGFARASATSTTYDFTSGFVAGADYAIAISKYNFLSPYLGYVQPFGTTRTASGPQAAASTSAGWSPWATATGVDQSTCAPIKALAADPLSATGFYAGGLCGVLKGTNRGTAVAALGTGLPTNVQVDALAVTPDGKTIYAGVFGGGVYRLTP